MTTTTDNNPLPNLTLGQIEEILARQGCIAILWSIEDVQELRPDLSTEQCMEVLHEYKQEFDAEIGITWQGIEMRANDLFPRRGRPQAGDSATTTLLPEED